MLAGVAARGCEGSKVGQINTGRCKWQIPVKGLPLFYAQARIRKFAADAACGARGG